MHSKVEQIVYVVDDDADVREGLCALLQSVGLKVVALSSTVEFPATGARSSRVVWYWISGCRG